MLCSVPTMPNKYMTCKLHRESQPIPPAKQDIQAHLHSENKVRQPPHLIPPFSTKPSKISWYYPLLPAVRCTTTYNTKV